MKTLAILLLFALPVFSQLLDGTADLYSNLTLEQKTQGDVTPILSHIVRSGGKKIKDDTTITGKVWVDFEIEALTFTDKIPLIIDHGLGCGLILNGKLEDTKEVQLSVKFPKMTDPNGKIYENITRMQPTYRDGGDTVVDFSYIFDSEWELVPGIWKIQFSIGDIIIGDFQFQTFKP